MMSAIDARQLVSTQRIAYVLGVAPATVRRLAAEGKIPAFRVGRQLRFDEDELIGTQPMTHPASYARSEREGY
jgi:excisionase family DNA binding protein